ncbi:MAG: hypothetical protein AAF458_13245 [Pseudomonadota bacterium]
MSDAADFHARVAEFVDLYCELARVNTRIGIWDMRRHAECKKRDTEVDKFYLIKTERLGRQSVERRAIVKTRLDALFAELVQNATRPD